MTVMVLNDESDEKNECPECLHPWYHHTRDRCEAPLCSCSEGKYPAWAEPAQADRTIRPGTKCYGHIRACTHTTDVIACRDCVAERTRTGRLFCADLDNCAGPGCFDATPENTEVRCAWCSPYCDGPCSDACATRQNAEDVAHE